MKTTAVDSKTLRRVGYDAQRRLLQLEFHNGSIYKYFEVPATVHQQLMQAASKGTYSNQSIRPRSNFALVKVFTLS